MTRDPEEAAVLRLRSTGLSNAASRVREPFVLGSPQRHGDPGGCDSVFPTAKYADYAKPWEAAVRRFIRSFQRKETRRAERQSTSTRAETPRRREETRWAHTKTPRHEGDSGPDLCGFVALCEFSLPIMEKRVSTRIHMNAQRFTHGARRII